jgi:5-methylcytosine-specific restriction endonuclease McrA
MSQKKQAVRNAFRNSVFKRDHYGCVICGKKVASIETSEDTLDAHHVTPREEMANGGYVKENGITLCKGNDGTSCHEKAEAYLKGESHDVSYAPDTLYQLIQSTREIADRASKTLGK